MQDQTTGADVMSASSTSYPECATEQELRKFCPSGCIFVLFVCPPTESLLQDGACCDLCNSAGTPCTSRSVVRLGRLPSQLGQGLNSCTSFCVQQLAPVSVRSQKSVRIGCAGPVGHVPPAVSVRQPAPATTASRPENSAIRFRPS